MSGTLPMEKDPDAGLADDGSVVPADGARGDTADVRIMDGPRDSLASPDGIGPAAAPQCLKDTDCALVNDCCHCVAIAKDQKPPYCDPAIACLTVSCTKYGTIEKPRCVAGRCILGVGCDTSMVTCRVATPSCEPGQVPVVALSCYRGCVDARQCLYVPSCDACASGDLCVRNVRGGPPAQTLHCAPRPPACGASGSCGCVGPAVCIGPFTACKNAAPPNPPLTCECPNASC